MSSGFLLTILKATSEFEQGHGAMSIIIRQPYAHLLKEINRAFKGKKDVTVIVERRHRQRRTSMQPVKFEERRRGDRRRAKEQLLEVVLSV
ncbi:MAG: hypothetical protein KAV87_05380 [Desulfobacteraceae bacterium]|nr:hypothetical protein [Desulfobacteraceae bacterium]